MGCGCGKKFTGRPASRLSTPATITAAPANKTGPVSNTIRSAPTPTYRAGQTVVRGRV